MAGMFKKNKRYGTRDKEEMKAVIKLLNDRAAALGRRPKKLDMTGKELGMIKKCFGKWCYALEAAGLSVPSDETIARREAKAAKWKRKHKAAQERRKLRNRVPKDVLPKEDR